MEQYTDSWMQLISDVEKRYSGEKVYAMNWGGLYYNVTNPDFLRAVDRVGIDAFYKHNVPSGSDAESIEKSWREFGLIEIQMMKDLTGKEPFLAEVGTRSQIGSWQNPPLWKDETAPVDQNDQATFYEATCQAVLPEVSGWYPWALGRNSLSIDPAIDFSFDPTNKKAEKVIRNCNEQVVFEE